MLTTIVIIVVIIVAIIVGGGAWMATRRRALRDRFGPEYDRVAEQHNSRLAADRELRARERAHEQLNLRPLPEAARQRYRKRWRDIQALFVEDPTLAVTQADELVTTVLGEIGYPTEDYDTQTAHLSVRHAGVLEHYREAHDVHLLNQSGKASTEQLRQSLVHYRFLFDDLLAEDQAGTPAGDGTVNGVTGAIDGHRPPATADSTTTTDTAAADNTAADNLGVAPAGDAPGDIPPGADRVNGATVANSQDIRR